MLSFCHFVRQHGSLSVLFLRQLNGAMSGPHSPVSPAMPMISVVLLSGEITTAESDVHWAVSVAAMEPGFRRVRFCLNYTARDLRYVVHAAAENTSTLATMTGDAFISTP